jgi:hypothetical protein
VSLYEDGSVWYSRYYGYNLGGSRAMVIRDDAVNGSHWDMYSYDEVSGRLASVQDVWTGETNGFAWNPEGTLARWEQPSSYGGLLAPRERAGVQSELVVSAFRVYESETYALRMRRMAYVGFTAK